MPVTTPQHLARIKLELSTRYQYLADCLEGRPLKSPSEGVGGPWSEPEKMAATTGTAMELRLAVKDFSAILAEIARMK